MRGLFYFMRALRKAGRSGRLIFYALPSRYTNLTKQHNTSPSQYTTSPYHRPSLHHRTQPHHCLTTLYSTLPLPYITKPNNTIAERYYTIPGLASPHQRITSHRLTKPHHCLAPPNNTTLLRFFKLQHLKGSVSTITPLSEPFKFAVAEYVQYNIRFDFLVLNDCQIKFNLHTF